MRDDDQQLRERIVRQVRRMRAAEHNRQTLIVQTLYLGTLGLVLVLPVVAGAYIGSWLDGLSDGYSVRWTLGSIIAGLIVGCVNVWLLIRD